MQSTATEEGERECGKRRHLCLDQLHGLVPLPGPELGLQPGLRLDLGLGNWPCQRRSGLAPPTHPGDGGGLPGRHCWKGFSIKPDFLLPAQSNRTVDTHLEELRPAHLDLLLLDLDKQLKIEWGTPSQQVPCSHWEFQNSHVIMFPNPLLLACRPGRGLGWGT